jgi:signal peptidase I
MNTAKPKSKGKFLKFIIFLILIAVIIKGCVCDVCKIPTGSMENTLLIGDYIVVNKVSYKLTTPVNIPMTDIKIPNADLFNFKKPERNDIIVFDFPGQLNEFEPPYPYYFIKRLIGKPGDTVEIKQRKVYVNGVLIEPPEGAIANSEIIKKGVNDPLLFSPGKNWNIDNYGPIVVPKRGDVIDITRENIKYWGMLINRELEKKTVSTEGSVITIEGTPVKRYTFRKDYYFVLGDNREDSMDSRYWGFVPEESIIGKASFIYWSWDPFVSLVDVKELFGSIKWRRVFKGIK